MSNEAQRQLPDLLLGGVFRRLDEIVRLLRRIDARSAGEPVSDDMKAVVFDEASPNGRLT